MFFMEWCFSVRTHQVLVKWFSFIIVGKSALVFFMEKKYIFCNRYKYVLHIVSQFSWCLNKMTKLVLFHEVSDFLFLYNLSTVSLCYITMGSNKILDNRVTFGVLIYVIHPSRQIFEWFSLGKVEADNDCIWVFVEKSCNWAKFFLSSCVPDLQFHMRWVIN